MILFQYYRLKSEHEYFTIRQTHDHWKLFLLRLIIQLWSNLCRTFEKLRYQSRVWAFQRNQIIPGWNTRNHTSSPMYFIHELHKLKLRLLMNADTRINSHLWSGVEVYRDSFSSDTNPGSRTRTSETWPLYVPATSACVSQWSDVDLGSQNKHSQWHYPMGCYHNSYAHHPRYPYHSRASEGYEAEKRTKDETVTSRASKRVWRGWWYNNKVSPPQLSMMHSRKSTQNAASKCRIRTTILPKQTTMYATHMNT